MTQERRLDYRDPEWLADQLGVDKSTIYRYLQEGALPGLQLGRKWLVSERQVIEFLDEEAHRQTTTRRGITQGGFRQALQRFRSGEKDRFERFTDRARLALSMAQNQAISFNHNYVGTEHILLGLLDVQEGLALKVLSSLHVDPVRVRAAVEKIIGRGSQPVAGEIGLTPRAKKAIDLAFEEAQRLNHDYVGTEHLLLGLINEGEGIAAGILGSMDLTRDQIRAETERLLAERSPDDSPQLKLPE